MVSTAKKIRTDSQSEFSEITSHEKANATAIVRPPHLALVGQTLKYPDYPVQVQQSLFIGHRDALEGLICMAVNSNTISSPLLQELMMSPAAQQDHCAKQLLEDITVKLANVLGDDASPYVLSLTDDEHVYSNNDSSINRLGLYLTTVESVTFIQCASPVPQLNDWFKRFICHMSHLLGYITCADIIEQEIEYYLELMGVEEKILTDNAELIHGLIFEKDEKALVDALDIDVDNDEVDDICQLAQDTLSGVEYVKANSDETGCTFTQLREELCEFHASTPELSDEPLVKRLLDRLPIMIAHEKPLKSLWAVITAEGDAYIGDSMITFTDLPNDFLVELVDRHAQSIFECGESAYVSVDYKHPNAMRVLKAYVGLATEFMYLNQH